MKPDDESVQTRVETLSHGCDNELKSKNSEDVKKKLSPIDLLLNVRFHMFVQYLMRWKTKVFLTKAQWRGLRSITYILTVLCMHLMLNNTCVLVNVTRACSVLSHVHHCF